MEYLKYSMCYKWQSELFIYVYDLNICIWSASMSKHEA